MLTFLVLSSKEQNIQYPIQYQHCHPGNKVSYNKTYLTNIAFICAVWRMTEELSFVPEDCAGVRVGGSQSNLVTRATN